MRSIIKKIFIAATLMSSFSTFAEPVEDNSYLVEEAYNQEPGVVQFINVYQRSKNNKDWSYVFINEIPVVSQNHQFSYELPYSFSELADKTGSGDIKFNYRYEFLRNDFLVTTGRISFTVPTGDYKNGFGSDAVGYETSLLASVKINSKWVQHWNVGAALTPKSKNITGDTADNSKYFWNLSNVYLHTDTLNFMLEMSSSLEQSTVGPDAVTWSADTIISPSVRYAIDIADWQYVPGLAFPTNIADNAGSQNQTLVYLSIEGKMW